MVVSDIYNELKEMLGSCDEPMIFLRLTRGIQLLANKGLFDPLLAYLDVHLSGGYTFALPRDVKTPIRVNINSNPSFPRARLFEFGMNTEGSNEGESVGWEWDDRGFIPIQDETLLPSKLSYRCVDEDDTGKTITVYGTDTDGFETKAVLVAALANGAKSEKEFLKVDGILRDATEAECYLDSDEAPVARYYPDERVPSFRSIKFSKTGVAVRILYRKKIFKVTSQDDLIPLNSEMAVILATRAADLWMQDNFQSADALLMQAEKIIKEEQATVDEASVLSKEIDVQATLNTNIRTRDCIIVADVYDDACAIVGAVGRQKVFDAVTEAVEALANRAHWDSTLGYGDFVKMANTDSINFRGSKGHGLYCLPRIVETVLAMNICGSSAMPRNKWCEFHLSGTGQGARAPMNTWSDAGETVIINGLKIDATTKLTTPSAIVAVPDVADDNDTEVRVFGYERLADGSEKRIVVDGEDGMVVPCVAGSFAIDADLPQICRIDRITKGESIGFIKLVTVVSNSADVLLGYYEPDEFEPHYRVVMTPRSSETVVRMRFRVRSKRFTSLYQPIFLRSRIAIKTALSAIKEKDPKVSVEMMTLAVDYLRQEQAINNPHNSPAIQIAPGTMPFVTANEQVQ